MANDDGRTPRQWTAFTTSKVTICATVIRLMFIFELLPAEISLLLHLPAVQSTMVRVRDTRRFLQVASAFRGLFPSFSQAYHASTSPPLPLVLASYLGLEQVLSPLSDYWQGVLWGLGLLVVDFLIAMTLESMATLAIQQTIRDLWEERLEHKMPKPIQPPRKHLIQLSETAAKESKPLLVSNDIPLFAALLYFFSPVTCMASGLYESFQNVSCLCLLWSIHTMSSEKQEKSVAVAALSFAFAGYLQPWSMVFSVPVCLFQQTKRKAYIFAALSVLWLLSLRGLDLVLVGTDGLAWKPTISLTPNLGPLWYFQMQIFDRFPNYFSLLFSGLSYLLVIPLTVRLHRYPIVLITSFWFIGALFSHNPAIYDFNVGLCLMLMSPRCLVRTTTLSVVAFSSIIVPISLYIMDYWLWLETGSGNANYMFFQCLAYNGFVAMIFLDYCSASLRRDKALRLTEKEGTKDKK